MQRQYDQNGKTIRKIDDKILCTKCNTYLSADKFSLTARDGYSYCKECVKKKYQERRGGQNGEN